MLHRPIAKIVVGILAIQRRQELKSGQHRGRTDHEAYQRILAAVSLLIVAGTMSTARADNDANRITLYTSAIHTGVIACNAINVSKKTLNITISIFDGTMPTGHETSPALLEGPTLIKTPPGMEATIDHGSPTDSNEGYCVFQVSGTGNRDDVRAIQNAVLAGTRTVDVEGVATTFPIFIHRVLEAH